MNIHVGLNMYVSVLTTCTFIFRQICTKTLKTMSGMHRPFEDRHLGLVYLL